MTREEKNLLLRDLCGRLPYNFVYCYCNAPFADGKPIVLTPVVISNLMNATEDLVIKPYLRPMSSMTEEEKIEFDEVIKSCNNKVFACPEKERRYKFFDAEQEDFMNAHYFDYRIVPSTGKTLIESNLALEAPEGMYSK